mmetsp:Transcript_5256/g.7877  ORF Transcript_5256/g.7877 Transcript_5256/m.7877 type:complete len:83 (-) Transcript_5256:174-422(-)
MYSRYKRNAVRRMDHSSARPVWRLDKKGMPLFVQILDRINATAAIIPIDAQYPTLTKYKKLLNPSDDPNNDKVYTAIKIPTR